MRIAAWAGLAVLAVGALGATPGEEARGKPRLFQRNGRHGAVEVVLYNGPWHTMLVRASTDPLDYVAFHPTDAEWTTWLTTTFAPQRYLPLNARYEMQVGCCLSPRPDRWFYFPGLRSPIFVEHCTDLPEALRSIDLESSTGVPKELPRWHVSEMDVWLGHETDADVTWPAACDAPIAVSADRLRGPVSDACHAALNDIREHGHLVVARDGKRRFAEVTAVLPGIDEALR